MNPIPHDTKLLGFLSRKKATGAQHLIYPTPPRTKMEANEQMFKADEAVQIQSKVRLRPSHLGHDLVQITAGGIESHKNLDGENAPLLAKGNDDSGATYDGFGDGHERSEQHWSGDKDFEGRPWWNKPSVGGECLAHRRSH